MADRPLLRKLFMWGFVLPFWIAVGCLMLFGVYSSVTNEVQVHILNASDREVTVSTCHAETKVAARSNGKLETNCVRKPEALVTSVNGAVIETVPFPERGDDKRAEYLYNVEAVETYDLFDYTKRYSKYALMPSHFGGIVEVVGTLRGTRIVLLPDWTKLVFEGQELPGSIREGNHVVRLERPRAE